MTASRRGAVFRGLAPLAMAGTLAACAGAGFTPAPCPGPEIWDGQFDDVIRQDATRTLAEWGLTPQRLIIDTQRRQIRRPLLGHPGEFEEDDRVVGYLVWADVAQCPQGKVVLRYNSSCSLRGAYTRYGCVVEGLPSG